MKDVRIPGVAWAIAIIVLVGLIHGNAAFIETSWHVEPWMLDSAIAVLIAGLKTLNLGTDQLNQALSVIDALLMKRRAEETPLVRGEAIPLVMVDEIPERPNAMARWWVG